MKVNMHEAKSNLSKLVEKAAGGEEIIIARNGVPVARLLAIDPRPRQLGMLAGQLWISDDFDDPLPEDIQRSFDGLEP